MDRDRCQTEQQRVGTRERIPEISSSNPLISHLEKPRPGGGTMGFHTATWDELTIEPGLGDRGVLPGHAGLQSASLAPGAGDGLGENRILLRFLFLLWGSRVPDSPQSPSPPCDQHGPGAAPLSVHPPPRTPSLPSLPPPHSLSSWAKALVVGGSNRRTGAKMPVVGATHRSGLRSQDVWGSSVSPMAMGGQPKGAGGGGGTRAEVGGPSHAPLSRPHPG